MFGVSLGGILGDVLGFLGFFWGVLGVFGGRRSWTGNLLEFFIAAFFSCCILSRATDGVAFSSNSHSLFSFKIGSLSGCPPV